MIYNPKSGRQQAAHLLAQVLDVLARAGFEVEPIATRGPGDATRLAQEAAISGKEIAFAMGGDGTLREVGRGLLGTETVLAPLPAGTTNVLAFALGLPRDPLTAAQVMSSCRRRSFDIGLVGREPFLMQVSAGLDASVMAQQNAKAKKRFGKAAVAWTGLCQWMTYGFPEIELCLDGRAEQCSFFAACNIPHYAGSFRMAPKADPGDGLLDVVVFRGRGRSATLGFARDVALSRHVERSDVEVSRVKELEIVNLPEARVQVDGDILAEPSPLKISLSAQHLWVLSHVDRA